MTDKKLDSLIRRKAKLARKMQQLRAELDPALEERYGTHPGEIDCDPAIDALDYGLGPDYTLAEMDRDMAERGAPCRVSSKTQTEPPEAA
jgi:hypothetical protein